MSNKSLSRKKREKQNAELLDAMIKLRLAANLACKALIELTNYVKSVKFPTPKLEPGGVVSELNQFYGENKDNGTPFNLYQESRQIDIPVKIKCMGACTATGKKRTLYPDGEGTITLDK